MTTKYVWNSPKKSQEVIESLQAVNKIMLPFKCSIKRFNDNETEFSISVDTANGTLCHKNYVEYVVEGN